MSIHGTVGGVVKEIVKVPVAVGGVVKEAKKGVAGVGGVVREFYRNAMTIYELADNDYMDRIVFPYRCLGEDSSGSCTWYTLTNVSSYDEDTPNDAYGTETLGSCKYQGGTSNSSNIAPRGAFLFCETSERADFVVESIKELYSKIKLTSSDGATKQATFSDVKNLGKVSDIDFSICFGEKYVEHSNGSYTEGYGVWYAYAESDFKDYYVVHVATEIQLSVPSTNSGKRQYATRITFE